MRGLGLLGAEVLPLGPGITAEEPRDLPAGARPALTHLPLSGAALVSVPAAWSLAILGPRE